MLSRTNSGLSYTEEGLLLPLSPLPKPTHVQFLLAQLRPRKSVACSCDHSREDLSSSKISTSAQGVVAQQCKLM